MTQVDIRGLATAHAEARPERPRSSNKAGTDWFNLKYYTWVEQQGKTIEELDAQRNPEFWPKELAKVEETDRRLRELREA